MYLKRLEIQGFKSFAKKTALEFEPGVTSIVGPNGSGKSNVADSLRWVLGEQSSKLLRGKKSDDVIFAGSDKKVKLGFAEVAATFDNHDHKIPVDASEVSIGRRIDRSGESEYLLNGAKVRLLDIVDLVLKSNIGTSRYTVIGQGTIDQMILAGPPEIKNLLDEASGVKAYYMKREKTMRRLEQTAQNLMRAEDLMRELEPRLKSLRRQAKRMEARTDLESELKTYQHEWFGYQYWQAQEQREILASKLGVIRAQREGLERQLASHRSTIEAHEKNNASQLEERRVIHNQLQLLRQQKNKLLEQLSFIQGKMQSAKTAGSRDPQTLQVEAHTLGRRIAELKAQETNRTVESGRLQSELASLQKTLVAASSHLEKLYDQLTHPVAVDWSGLGAELAVLDKEFTLFDSAMQHAVSIDEVLVSASGLRKSFDNFKQAAERLINHPDRGAGEVQKQLQEFVKQKENLQTQVQVITLKFSQANLEVEFLAQEIEKLETEKLNIDLELKKVQGGKLADFWQELVREEEKVKGELNALGQNIADLETGVQELYAAENAWRAKITDQEKEYRSQYDAVSIAKDKESQLAVEKARCDTQYDQLLTSMHKAVGTAGVELIKREKVQRITASLEEKIAKLAQQLELIGGVDELTLQEYNETESRYSSLHAQVTDLKKGIDDLRNIIEELDEHIKNTFNEAFHKINAKFEQYFRMLFNGGQAHLTLLRAADTVIEVPDEEKDDEVQASLRPEEKMLHKYEKVSTNVTGVDIKATPPGKKLASVQALSGGERALTSIALLCSLLSCFPSPFVVLDEVDAALDEANTIRFGQILGSLAHQTQFITITHNRETMVQSNALYGVTMEDDGVSKLLSIKFDQAKVYAK